MFKNLARAYNDFIKGIYRPELIALNPKEWDWLKKAYLPYEEARIIVRDYFYDPEIDKCPKWILYKYSFLVLTEEVPVGKIRMWRLEPKITLRETDLELLNYTQCRYDFSFSVISVSCGDRLQEI